MIDSIDIVMFIRQGFVREGIGFGMSIKELKEKIGDPDSVIGDTIRGYLMYDCLRFGYLDDIVDEIAILFCVDDNFRLKINLENVDDEITVIAGTTKINEFIKLLSINGINWQSQYRKNELDYVSIHVENKSAATFELQTGFLTRIALYPPAE